VRKDRSVRKDIIAATGGVTACSLPTFMLGTLAVQLQETFHFGASGLGTAVAAVYLGSAASAVPLAAIVEGVGGLRAMRVACVLSAIVLILLPTLPGTWAGVVGLMALAGIASACVQSASNLFLARRIPPHQLGFAFGFKQAAVPFATALAGIAVPSLALTVGWRWAYVVASACAAITAVLLPRSTQRFAQRRASRRGQVKAPVRRRPLVVLAVGFGMAIGAATALTAFVVSSAVASGVGHGEAGLLATLGGVAALIVRILSGRQADRRGGAHLRVVAIMLAIGAIAYVALAVVSASHATALYLPVVTIVFGAGWGWNGLFNLAVVRSHLEQPATATGITQTGGRLGAVIMPFVFGQIVTHASYGWAWTFAACCCTGGAGTMLLGRRLLRATPALTPNPA
jgi:MFS family permease